MAGEITLEVVSHGVSAIREQMKALGKDFDPDNVVVKSEMKDGKLHIYISYPFVFLTHADVVEIKKILDQLRKVVPEDIYNDTEAGITLWLKSCVRVVG